LLLSGSGPNKKQLTLRIPIPSRGGVCRLVITLRGDIRIDEAPVDLALTIMTEAGIAVVVSHGTADDNEKYR
jgi:hypothetical protein